MVDVEVKATTWLVYERLLKLHGDHPLIPRREPLHELISTMLSHRTTEASEERAFQQMWRRFGSWEAIRAAPPTGRGGHPRDVRGRRTPVPGRVGIVASRTRGRASGSREHKT